MASVRIDSNLEPGIQQKDCTAGELAVKQIADFRKVNPPTLTRVGIVTCLRFVRPLSIVAGVRDYELSSILDHVAAFAQKCGHIQVCLLEVGDDRAAHAVEGNNLG